MYLWCNALQATSNNKAPKAHEIQKVLHAHEKEWGSKQVVTKLPLIEEQCFLHNF